MLMSCTASAGTNNLNLMWVQPVGYQSTIYQATNINGQWQPLAVTAPPAALTCTQSSAFFIVVMTPTNQVPTIFGNYAGGEPNFTPAGSNGVAVDTSNGTEWFYYNAAWH